MFERVGQSLQTVVREHAGGTVVAVTSGGPGLNPLATPFMLGSSCPLREHFRSGGAHGQVSGVSISDWCRIFTA